MTKRNKPNPNVWDELAKIEYENPGLAKSGPLPRLTLRRDGGVKILHVADLHFRQQWFEWVATQANQFDAVCIAGDLLNMNESGKVVALLGPSIAVHG